MKVLVIGSGGREHALVWKIQQSNKVTQVFCAPGNGGTAREARNLPLAVDQINELAHWARQEKIDLTVVGPELPLTLGIVDHFKEIGVPIIGPTAAAAQLESSKIFAKEFMQRHHIPTSPYVSTASPVEAVALVRNGGFGFPLVIKADGLASGKGVIIVQDLKEADLAIQQIMQARVLGKAGERIIVEQFLHGEEISFQVFSDGVHFLPIVPSQDHKTVFDYDLGPNTGGMGAYSDDRLLSLELHQQIMKTIVSPTIEGMAAEGMPYRGILYFGLMLTPDGIKVLEFNARLGDPETQPTLFRLESDIIDVFQAILERRLDQMQLRWDQNCSVCVILASGGYPGKFEEGKSINGIEEAESLGNVKVFHAGTETREECLVSRGGRVLGVTAKAETLRFAINMAYKGVEKIYFDKMHYRSDIGRKGIIWRGEE
jgi:phosphoribosylamine---glycine ligase